ncbi:MAG: large ribosomal subunit protein uL14 [Cytophagales bacterium]
MIKIGTKLNGADNTGAQILQCIGIPKSKKWASIGDVISVSVKKAKSPLKGKVKLAIVVRQKKEKRRKDGSYISFTDNAACLINAENKPEGTRVKGPIGQEVREKIPALGNIAALIY